MDLFIALAVIYTVVLLIWTKVNVSGTKANGDLRRDINEELREINDTNREVEGITVSYRTSPPITLTDGKAYDKLRDHITIYDADREPIAHIERGEIEGIYVHRKGESDGE